LDYRHPRGTKITVGFVRLPASDRAHRVGSLIINPGGPGGQGSQFVGLEAAGRHLWHPALHRRFDLIGMDPRGLGLSTQVRCAPARSNPPVSLFPRTVKSYEDLRAKIVLGRALAPHTQGAGETWLGLTECLRWPVPLANPPHSVRVRGTPPILLVGATHDPSTPYVWAHGLRDQIPSAVLLTRDGDGHTSSWLGPRSRTNDAIVDYLITGKAPPPNTVYPN
jgi:pimeloyl-ACP methyl ester carboxylesterase